MDERTVNEEETAALERLIQIAQGDTCVFRSLLDSGDDRSWTFSSALVVTSKSRM